MGGPVMSGPDEALREAGKGKSGGDAIAEALRDYAKGEREPGTVKGFLRDIGFRKGSKNITARERARASGIPDSTLDDMIRHPGKKRSARTMARLRTGRESVRLDKLKGKSVNIEVHPYTKYKESHLQWANRRRAEVFRLDGGDVSSIVDAIKAGDKGRVQEAWEAILQESEDYPQDYYQGISHIGIRG